jgi:hypothetical protein
MKGGIVSFSLVLRRTHMYAALFLTPWMLIYALSTMAMNHRDFIRDLYGGKPQEFELEREMDYTAAFSENASRQMVARQILQDLDLEGAFSVRGRLDRGSITITRGSAVGARRITYTPNENRLRVERVVYNARRFLEEMHRRRGYRHSYLVNDLWAFSVDLVIIAMLFWVGSGLWMWWELSAARRWGTLCAAGGLALYALFLLTI